MTRRDLLASALACSAPPAWGEVLAGPADLVVPGRPDSMLAAAVIARDGRGRPVLSEAHGLSLLGEGDGRIERSFTLDTPVRVASVSKMVAMAGVMRVAAEGRLDLNADVSGPLGFRLRHPDHPAVAVTPAMLASHTSGLRNGANYPVAFDRRLQDAFAAERDWWSPAGEPPGWFSYSDANFAVLAQLLERVTGERFDRWMSREVLAPLKLDAGYNWSGVSDAKRWRASAACRLIDGRWTPQTDAVVPPAPRVRILAPAARPEMTADDYAVGENGFAFSPQGGLRASVADLDRLAQAFGRGGLAGAGVLKLDSVAAMTRPRWRFDGRNGSPDGGLIRAYGLAVHVPTGVAGSKGDAFFGPGSADWRGHFGEAYGVVSGCFWNLKDGRTLAYVVNGSPEAAARTGRRSALTPWEETVVDAALAAWA